MRRLPRIGFAASLLLVLPVIAMAQAPTDSVTTSSQPPDTTSSKPTSMFIDPEDGWFDLGAFLDTGGGFVPLFIPVTEPAVGYGVAGALVFINKNEPLPDGGYRRPNISAVGGLWTENDTWATFAGHSGSWDNDRWQTLVGGIYGDINLDFYGLGEGDLNNQPAAYTLTPAGGVARAAYRLGKSPIIVGLSYAYATMKVSFDGGNLPVDIDSDQLDTRLAALTPSLTFDTRSNYFTPVTGLYLNVEPGLFLEALGGTSDFQRLGATVLAFQPVSSKLFLGIKGESQFSFGDAPFYTRPYISLRGIAALRYLGEHAASAEFEARWQCWKRFSLVGFTGAGVAWTNFDNLESSQDVFAGGGGIRYEIARRYGLHMGIDAAFGPDEGVVYLQFGHAWLKP